MSEVGGHERIHTDPAPSRWSYKLLRLMLSPFLRRLVFFGIPVFLFAFVVAINVLNEDRRDHLRATYDEIYMSIIERPEFMVNLMSIHGASDSLMQDIREVVPADLPTSSFILDLDHMQRVISGLAPVKDVNLRIRSGGILEINIVERTPTFVWRRDKGLELLDDMGIHIKSIVSRLDYPTLPLIAGEGADDSIEQAKKIFEAAEPLQDRMRGLVFIGDRRWNIILDRGQTLMLPEKSPIEALESIIFMDRASELLSRDVIAVDFRIKNRPTLHLSAGAIEELKTIKFTGSRALE